MREDTKLLCVSVVSFCINLLSCVLQIVLHYIVGCGLTKVMVNDLSTSLPR